jgi:hypothetical protein
VVSGTVGRNSRRPDAGSELVPNSRGRSRPARSGQRPATKSAAKNVGAQKIAAARAARAAQAAAAQAARRRNLMLGGAGVAVVLIIVGVIIAVGVSGKKSKTTANPVVPASSAVTTALGKAAAVTTTPANFSTVTGPPSRLTGGALTGADGKPEVLYVGAEWCPYCAVTRWPLTVALSRFGTFTNLQTTKSAVDDGNIPTLSYHGASYTSTYIDFVPVEAQDGLHHTLDTLTTAQSQLFESLGSGQFPLVDFGGKWKQKGASANPAVLAGLTPDAVAAQLSDPASNIGSMVQQGADVFSAVICGLDGGKPAGVCTAPAVTAATTALASIK